MRAKIDRGQTKKIDPEKLLKTIRDYQAQDTKTVYFQRHIDRLVDAYTGLFIKPQLVSNSTFKTLCIDIIESRTDIISIENFLKSVNLSLADHLRHTNRDYKFLGRFPIEKSRLRKGIYINFENVRIEISSKKYSYYHLDKFHLNSH
ncbi:MAG: hypothetical protein AAGF15_11785, partial [Pseudomonadota bacterium]